MTRKGIEGEVQDQIVTAITAFALYGFPENHAASFALFAYASGYLKCHYLAAFIAAILNNQPMGFYGSHTSSRTRNGMGCTSYQSTSQNQIGPAPSSKTM